MAASRSAPAFSYCFRTSARRLSNLSTLLSQDTGASSPPPSRCISAVVFMRRDPSVFSEITGIKGNTVGRRKPRCTASNIPKSRSPMDLA